MEIQPNLILENSIVQLRPLQFSDVDNFLEFSENESEIWKYSLTKPDGKANLENYLNIALNARDAKTEFPFIVFDKRTQKYAGSTRFYDINFDFKTIQLGYTWYGKNFQGTGLNKNCKYLLLEYAFETLEMERVEFRADSNNAKSIAAMKSIGCQVDGILRNNMPNADNSRRSSIVLSILCNEWFENVKNELRKKL